MFTRGVEIGWIGLSGKALQADAYIGYARFEATQHGESRRRFHQRLVLTLWT